MKKIFTLLTLVTSMAFMTAQSVEGPRFSHDPKVESAPEFVLMDNYNSYLLSVVNTDGMTARREIILRKFDQQNQLVETYTHAFPKFDISTLHNYLGFADSKNGKLAVFTQTYSGKAKKCVIYKLEFDKASGTFTDTELASLPILSAMKSGTVSFSKSDNELFAAINYAQHRPKEEQEKNLVLVIDTKTLNVAWQKEFSFEDKAINKFLTVTNSGKVVFTRVPSSYKLDNYLVVATADGPREIKLETNITLQNPYAISLGAQEYLLAFNAPSKGIRRGDFSHLMLFDIESGKIIQNSQFNDFHNGSRIVDILFRNMSVTPDEIRFYAEGKVEMEMKKTMTSGSFSNNFEAKTYKFGPAALVKMGIDGAIKSVQPISVDLDSSNADLYHSFGILKIKGEDLINTGHYLGLYKGSAKNRLGLIAVEPNLRTPRSTYSDSRYINQLVYYFPDGDRSIFVNGNAAGTDLRLITATGVN